MILGANLHNNSQIREPFPEKMYFLPNISVTLAQKMKTSATQKSNGRYVYETKRQGRIAHHHTDATVPHIVALPGFSFHAAKIRISEQTTK